MRNTRRQLVGTVAAGLAVGAIVLGGVGSPAAAERTPKEIKRQAKRQIIDATARETLDRLFAKSKKAKMLFAKAYGYAVFDNLKLSFGISGGGGNGVAVVRSTGKRTYMKMGTVGIGLGLGGQKYQVVFLFQDPQTFSSFVDKGWQADASANAVAGNAGANAQTGFVNGMAIYQLTEAGLMLQADVAGTKYWKSRKLNRY